jgi:hypothetical protein
MLNVNLFSAEQRNVRCMNRRKRGEGGMKRFYCKGKKGYCDRGNDDTIDCKDCEFANGTGGEIVDAPDTVYEKIKCMSIEELADWLYANCEWLSAEYGACSGSNDYLHLLEFLNSADELQGGD